MKEKKKKNDYVRCKEEIHEYTNAQLGASSVERKRVESHRIATSTYR
jgi:hypothetical protein